MALFTSSSNEDDSVQLYAKTSEDLSETSLIFKHQTELKKHNRMLTISFILHAISLLVIIILLSLLLRSSDSKQTNSPPSQQVAATSKVTQNNTIVTNQNATKILTQKDKKQLEDELRNEFKEQVQEWNSTFGTFVKDLQLMLLLSEHTSQQLELQEGTLNMSIQNVLQEFQSYKLATNTTLERLSSELVSSQQALNGTSQNMKQRLDSHEREANSSFTKLNLQQQNSTDVLRGEFSDQIQTLQQGMEESINETQKHLTEIGNFVDYVPSTPPPPRSLPVYNQERTTSNYLYKDNLANMSAMTACFWFNGEQSDDRKLDFLISIAVSNQPNEFIIGWEGYGKLGVWIRDVSFTLEVPTAINRTGVFWVGWNKHCFTWKAGYQFKWYTDTITNGQLQLMGSVNVSRDTVRSGGHMTLLQEQDSLGGTLDLSQTTPGKLADFNMWNFEMTADQVNAFTCESVGNVASWDTLKQHGTAQVTYEVFPQCKDRVLPVYNQAHTLSHYRYQRSLPAMSQMTTCFWFNGLASDDKNGDFLISIAIPQQQNELIIGWQYNSKMSIYIQGDAKSFPLSAQYDDMNTLWVGWHKHCFTFKAGDKAKWYTDLATSGYVELVSTVDVSADTIRSGGFMTLLQEQDSFGGSFDLTQTVPGKMAEFNMWNRQMTADELNTGTCGGAGNVASWDTLLYFGTANITYEHFPLCTSG